MLSFDFKSGDVGEYARQFKNLNIAQQTAILKSKNFNENEKKFLAKSANLDINDLGNVITTNHSNATKATKGLSSAFVGLWATMKPVLAALATNPLTWIATIGTATIALHDYFTVDYAEANAALDESKQKYTETTETLKSLNEEYKTNQERIEKLQKLKDNGSITSSEQNELNTLTSENEELNRKIALKEKLLELEQQEAIDDAKEAVTKESHSVAQSVQMGDASGKSNPKGEVDKVTDAEAIKEDTDLINKYENKILPDLQNQLSAVQKDIENANNPFTKWLKELEAADIKSKIEHYKTSLRTLYADLESRSANVEEQLALLKLDPDANASEIETLEFALSNITDQLVNAGNALKTVDANSNTFINTSSGVHTLSSGLDQLSKIYNDVKDGGNFDYSSILNNEDFTTIFGSYTEEYDNFIQTIANSPKDINACQDAFNELADAYISGSGALDSVTEETKEGTIALLKQKGVANADELVMKRLVAQKEFLAAKERIAAIESKNLTDITLDEVNAIIAEGIASSETQAYLAALSLAKININNLKLDTKSDIDNIIAVANAAGASAEYLDTLRTALGVLQNHDGKINYGYAVIADPDERAKHEAAAKAEQQVKDIFNSINTTRLNASDFYGDATSNADMIDSNANLKSTAETFNWLETALSRVQRTITNLGKAVAATWKSWTTRNTNLASQIAEVNKEIALQTQAYNTYMTQANAVGLSENYKSLIRSGSLHIEAISDENLKQKIQEYQDWYEKALACDDAIHDLNEELATLAKQKFDNVSKRFDDKLSVLEHRTTMLDSSIDQLETQGYTANSEMYESLIQVEQSKLLELQSKYEKLKSSMNGVERGTELWYEMYDQVLSTKEEIQNSTNAIIEYNNAMHELDWKVFDKVQEKLSGIQSESDFLIDLMSDEDMFDETGTMTKYGQTTMGLHAVNYNKHMHQAEQYKGELEKLEEELAKDPNNQTLLDRKDELYESWMKEIQAAEEARQSMIDLGKDGYDALLDSMDKLIEKRKTMLSQAKELSDYEKNISEQTEEIASLEKQLAAYQGDTSEESRATIQKLKVSLEEARENLKETEYDKYISDQERLLDNLYSQTEEWINKRLDDEDMLIEEFIASTNANAESIKETLQQESDKVGFTLSNEMESIWSPSGSFGSVVTTYCDDFLTQQTTTNNILTNMMDYISGIMKQPNGWVQNSNGSWSYNQSGQRMKNDWIKHTDNKWYHLNSEGTMDANRWIINDTGTWSYVDGSGAAVTGWQYLEAGGRNDWYAFDNEGNMYENQWIGDYFVGKDGRMLTGTWVGHDGTYYYVGGDGKWYDYPGWTSSTKPSGNHPIYEYAKGSRYIPSERLALLAEQGPELKFDASEGVLSLLGTGDKVFTNMQAENLWKISKSLDSLPANGMSKNVSFGDIHFDFNLPNVKNTNDFITELQHSKRFENIILEITDGKNCFSKYKW